MDGLLMQVPSAAVEAGASSLDELTDVVITTPAAGEALIYDGADWINGPIDLANTDAVTGLLPTANVVNLSGTNTGDQSVFRTIAVSGQSDVVADSATDTLTLAAGSNITITTNAGTDTVTITATGGGSGISMGLNLHTAAGWSFF